MLVLLLEGADLVLLDLQTGIAARLRACFAQCTCIVVCAAMSKKQDGACCVHNPQGTKASQKWTCQQSTLTCAAELSKAKIQQPQLIPSLVIIFAQHDVAACDVHVCQGATHMEAVHCLHNTSALHQQNARLDVEKAGCLLHDLHPQAAQPPPAPAAHTAGW